MDSAAQDAELTAYVGRRRREGRFIPSWSDLPRDQWPSPQTPEQRVACERKSRETQEAAAEKRSKRRRKKVA